MQATRSVTRGPDELRRHGGIVGPTLLITLGIVFLLNNLGYLSWGIWDSLVRLWPLALIAVGLDLLIGRRSMLGSAIVAVLLIAGVALAVWWAGFWLPSGTVMQSEAFSQSLNGAQNASIDIGMGAGQLSIGALSESANLIEGTFARGANQQVVRDVSMNGNTVVFKLHSQRSWPFASSDRVNQPVEWKLQLNARIPLRLHVDTGAGQSNIDLTQMRIDNLEVNIGVGQTSLVLPRHGHTQARVNGGIGSTIITLPAGVAARIDATTGLGQIQIVGDFQRAGSVSVSPGYDTAADRVDLTINGGIGSVVVRQESGR